jgi:hypothetical protein
MAFEIDHLFICTTFRAPEADRLVEFGLTEGEPNVHPGQGTSNRRFFFRNCMLELLWLRDEAEARSEQIAPTRLFERCTYWQTDASPFGLCFRSATDGEPAFPPYAWEYRPPYMPEGMSLLVADNSTDTAEPMLVYLPYRWRPDQFPDGRKQPLDHRAGLGEVSAVRVTIRKAAPYSEPLSAIENYGDVFLTTGAEDVIELSFDGETRGGYADFRPDLPLIFQW